jgi:hypothetical protein
MLANARKKVAAYPSVRFIDTEAIEATADGVIAGGSLHQALVFEPNGRWSATERTVTTSCLIDAAEGRYFPDA